MKIIHTPEEMKKWAQVQKKENNSIALVPTMGCLHEGHLSLVDRARQNGDSTVMSIFVNPMQFGPNEDLDAYPRQFEEDCRVAAERGVDVVFAPSDSDMYGSGFQTCITVKDLSVGLCGADRPGHFDGVATVVTKLFNITIADFAVFGEKDFQQLSIIRRLVDDLNMNIKIIAGPIVREADGLAMSSRNKYLLGSDREVALCLSRGIKKAKELVASGVVAVEQVLAEVKKIIADAGAVLEYAEIVEKKSLENQEMIDENSVLTVAAKIGGKVRLIDNSKLVI